MRTEVDICNNALSDTGHDREITSLSEGSAEALKCARQLPHVRRALFASYPWRCLRRLHTGPLEYADAPELHGWPLAWHLPGDRLAVGAVTDAAGGPLAWQARGDVLYTKSEPAAVEVCGDIEDPDLWPEYLAQAVTAALAHKLAVLMAKSAETMRITRDNAASSLAEAKRRDAAAHGSAPGARSPYAEARGAGYGQD